MKEQSLNPSDIAVKSLNLTYIEEIKRLMLDIFSGEPWNDHWSGDQLTPTSLSLREMPILLLMVFMWMDSLQE